MDCKKIKELITEKDTTKEEIIKNHISTCKECLKYYNFWLIFTKSSIKSAPAELKNKILERLPYYLHQDAKNKFFRFLVPAAITVCILVIFSVLLIIKKDKPVPVSFVFEYPGANKIALVGDFTGWQKDKIFLSRKNGIWTVTVHLKPGRYQYVFIVDDEKIFPDPKADFWVNDGFGSVNSVIDITKISEVSYRKTL